MVFKHIKVHWLMVGAIVVVSLVVRCTTPSATVSTGESPSSPAVASSPSPAPSPASSVSPAPARTPVRAGTCKPKSDATGSVNRGVVLTLHSQLQGYYCVDDVLYHGKMVPAGTVNGVIKGVYLLIRSAGRAEIAYYLKLDNGIEAILPANTPGLAMKS